MAALCLAVTLNGRMAAKLLMPGLHWPLWTAVLIGVSAAVLLVLVPDVSWFERDEISERLGNALLICLNVAFVALATGVIKRMGAPIWLAIPLGAVAVALAYIVMMAGAGETLHDTMVAFAFMSVMMGLIIPIFVDLRQKARTAYELRHHRPTLQAPPRSAPRDNEAPTASGSEQPRTGTRERGPVSPTTPGSADR